MQCVSKHLYHRSLATSLIKASYDLWFVGSEAVVSGADTVAVRINGTNVPID